MPALYGVPVRVDVHVMCTSAIDGDFNPLRTSRNVLEHRRRSLIDLPWTQLLEEHGTVVVDVVAAGDGDFAEGDVMVTSTPGSVLGIWTGDCAPVCIVGDRVIAAVHAGWRGIRDGVLDAAVAAVVRNGDSVRAAWIGPHIHPCCYEFGGDDLERMVELLGPGVSSVDRRGRPALDVDACVRSALERCTGHAVEIRSVGHCTGCHPLGYFSHRVRGEEGRQVTAFWIGGPS